MTENLTGDEALIRSQYICDDGCDWTAWYVWKMRERRQISEHVFSLPPARRLVMPPSIKPKKNGAKNVRQNQLLIFDYQYSPTAACTVVAGGIGVMYVATHFQRRVDG